MQNKNTLIVWSLKLLLIMVFSWLLAFSSETVLADKNWNNVKTWVYQLCKYKDNKLDEIANSYFDLAVIDLARDGGDDFFIRNEIEAVKKRGKIVLAYFEIGAIEDYRPEWENVPDDLKAGPVSGWPKEQYVKFWDKRWWPVVKDRIDQALKAGFNGCYLDMITTYEEIRIPKELKSKNKSKAREEIARRMVDLINQISRYAKNKDPDFKIVPQNSPELYTWNFWNGKINQKYIDAIDGIGMESMFYRAHDKPCDKDWCKENRDNASAVRKANKPVFSVDYARELENITDAYKKARKAGFIPYVSVKNLDIVLKEGKIPPQKVKSLKKRK